LIVNLSLLQLPLICCLDFEFLVFGVDARAREFVEFLRKKPKLVCSVATTALAFDFFRIQFQIIDCWAAPLAVVSMASVPILIFWFLK